MPSGKVGYVVASDLYVIDDHPLYRQGVMTLISQELHLECVGKQAL